MLNNEWRISEISMESTKGVIQSKKNGKIKQDLPWEGEVWSRFYWL